jgi:GNAT superfamily N-acetyltransferase
LSNVCVAQAARKQGVAAALMMSAEDVARSLGEQPAGWGTLHFLASICLWPLLLWLLLSLPLLRNMLGVTHTLVPSRPMRQ